LNKYLLPFVICFVLVFRISANAEDKNALKSLPASTMPGMLSSNIDPKLKVGVFGDFLTHQALWPVTSCDSLLICPWRLKAESDFMAGIDGVVTAYKFEKLPIVVEIQAGIGKRFGLAKQVELYLIPMLRWKLFPWNDYLYTNFRLGLLGGSYVTGVSDWEKLNAGNNGKGSNYLNLIQGEITFSPREDAPFEIFFNLHHRSGIFGLINGVHGGSNYVGTGIRFTAF
jgi:hypothetical protein